MGHSANTDVVPYIKRCAFELVDYVDVIDSPEYSTLLIPESVLFKECNWQTDDDTPEIKLRGWHGVEPENHSKIGKRNKLVAVAWAKDNNPEIKVYLLNESQCSNGGEYSVSIIADKKEYIEEFVKDFSDLFTNNFKIEGPGEAAVWWA